MNIFPAYICPLCQEPLSQVDKSIRCVNNHCFDFAKEGYVNLLPVQHKHSKDPGDNKSMVAARRAFLDQGYYQALVDLITALYKSYIDTNDSSTVLDAGCGEGFYTHQHKHKNNQVYGVDIAKNAIKIAAKRYNECAFSVGTLSHLPFSGQYFDWVYSIYAPILEQEFSRVLKPKGYLLTVTPAENHLIELKQLIYRDAKQHDTERLPINEMTLIEEQRLNYKMTFSNNQDLINLLAMTPFAFKTTPDLLSKLNMLTNFECQADFLIRLYQNT
ncbi:23S rRNA (guanine(745)-N(1))-methyltransferase [Colwelliaceae bacterium 6471]